MPFSCPWGSWGSCRFCGIPFMERVLAENTLPDDQLLAQFDSFAADPRNAKDIARHKRVAIAPNGSVVPEVPKALRNHVLRFCEKNNLRFESELIATLIDQERTRGLYERHFQVKMPQVAPAERTRMADETLAEIDAALNHDFPGKNVLLNTGLEVANEDDLKKLHKYTADLDDFLRYAEFLRSRKILVGANILLGPPMIGDPVRKALETVRFAFEKMRADKILLITWNPVKYTLGKKLYDAGQVDVLSATESAEIYNEARRCYPEKEIEFNRMRSHIYHGKHGNFRDVRINTDERKVQSRENVRTIARQVFSN